MPVFESTADDVLGLWTAAPQAAPLSFGLDAESAAPAGELYRTRLPDGPDAAQKVFDDSAAIFARVNSALDNIPARLDGLVERANHPKQAAGLNFAVGSLEQETGPEAELLDLLAAADRSGTGELNFGIGDLTGQAWDAARAQFDALIAQIDRDVLHFAWVETLIADQLVARTTVAWSGDTQTAWSAGVNAEQSRQHEGTLSIVTRTRHLRLRLFVTVASGSVRVAGLMATPGGAMLALPAVYQYVIKIVAQARELQSIQLPQGETNGNQS
jgi:hypothetical protein